MADPPRRIIPWDTIEALVASPDGLKLPHGTMFRVA